MRLFSKISILGLTIALFTGAGVAADSQMRMKGEMNGGMMQDMMQNPHHKLAMVHKKNLLNFAKTFKSEVSRTGKVDKDFAESAVKGMGDNLTQMQKHHNEAKSSMTEGMKTQKAEMIKMMEDRFDVVDGHLNNLEKEVKADVPDPSKVKLELDQIVKQCNMMKTKLQKKVK